MGRFVSGGSVPRSLRQVFEASNPSFQIPSWARFMRVSGCGAGASGGVSATTGRRGGGGGSGAQVLDLPLIIPPGVTTVSVSIGTPGAAVTSNVQANGNAGGATELTLGSVLAVRLGGGGAGNGDGTGGVAGVATVYPRASATDNAVSATAWSAGNSVVQGGLAGGAGNQSAGGFGAGASGHFGGGGAGVASSPGANVDGANGSGFGAGGAGALWLTIAPATTSVSGAGAPGILICEFFETRQ